MRIAGGGVYQSAQGGGVNRRHPGREKRAYYAGQNIAGTRYGQLRAALQYHSFIQFIRAAAYEGVRSLQKRHSVSFREFGA
jgi:hypothetical protein